MTYSLDKISFFTRNYKLITTLQILLSFFLLNQFEIANAAKISDNFDHYSSGFPLDGAHRKIRCSTCHQTGVFKGTPKTCFSCHGSQNSISSSIKSFNHIPSDNTCDNCHLVKSWFIVRMDHGSVTGVCFSCHNGNFKSAARKQAGHIPTNNDCASCHNTRRWKIQRFDHATISGNCIQCHNNPSASKRRGKPSNHPASSNVCETCHTNFRSWKSARFNHDNVNGNCVQCHNNPTASRKRGKPANHTKSSNLCENCHTNFRSWKGARIDHTTISNGCSSCHNGSTAGLSKSANHITTNNLCEACHSPRKTNWRNATMDHDQVSPTCITCHFSATAVKKRGKPNNHPASSNTCDSCHRGFKTWSGARFDHSNVTGQCSTCHNNQKAIGKNAGHFNTSLQCDLCHTSRTTFKTTKYNHSGSFPRNHSRYSCRSCHTTNSQTDVGRPPGKSLIPDCAGCHANKFRPGDHPGNTYSTLRRCDGACHKPTPPVGEINGE